jgi:hypothetical protein
MGLVDSLARANGGHLARLDREVGSETIVSGSNRYLSDSPERDGVTIDGISAGIC